MRIRPGLQRREWLRTLAYTMFSYYAESCDTQQHQPWGRGLPSLENSGIYLGLAPARLFMPWLQRGLHILHASNTPLSTGNTISSTGNTSFTPGNTSLTTGNTSVTTSSITLSSSNTVPSADTADSGQGCCFYQGENPLRFLKHCMANALSDSTIRYAFGSYAEVQEQENTYTSTEREQLDIIAEQFYALAPEVFCSLRPSWFDRKPARVTADEFYSWFIYRQSPIPLQCGYNPVDTQIFALSEAQRLAAWEHHHQIHPRSRLTPEDFDNDVLPPEVRLCCTYDVYGDDAGDESDPRQKSFTPLDHRSPKSGLRIYTIDSFKDYQRLLQRYPQPVTRWDGDYSYWAPGVTINLVLNWEAIAQDYDGVGLTIRGALDAAYVPCVTDSGVGILSGFTPGSVAYVRSPFLNPNTPHITHRTSKI